MLDLPFRDPAPRHLKTSRFSLQLLDSHDRRRLGWLVAHVRPVPVHGRSLPAEWREERGSAFQGVLAHGALRPGATAPRCSMAGWLIGSRAGPMVREGERERARDERAPGIATRNKDATRERNINLASGAGQFCPQVVFVPPNLQLKARKPPKIPCWTIQGPPGKRA